MQQQKQQLQQQHVVAAVACAVYRVACSTNGTGEEKAAGLEDESAGQAHIAALVEDRLQCIKPVIHAQVEHGINTGVSLHSAKGLVEDQVRVQGNAARHVDFAPLTRQSGKPLSSLKKLQR